jgi:hypothetical protein
MTKFLIALLLALAVLFAACETQTPPPEQTYYPDGLWDEFE